MNKYTFENGTKPAGPAVPVDPDYRFENGEKPTGGSVLLLELPREWTVTARCQRLTKQGGRRGDMARWLCENLLHPIDPDHCQ